MIKRVVILGAGRYSEVLLNVLLSPEERERGVEVIATHRRAERRAEIADKYDIRVLADNREACRDADMVYALVRPEQMADLMTEVGPTIQGHQIFATGAASLDLPFYRRYLPSKCALAWVFPPPFVGIKAGLLAMQTEADIDPDKLADLKEYWGRYCDEILMVNGAVIDSFTVLHACGQYFLYPVLKAMISYGEKNGFSRQEAQAVSLGTFKATAKYLSGIDCTQEWLELMMEDARVPGNMTAAGLDVLDARKAEEVYAETLQAAQRQAEINRNQ